MEREGAAGSRPEGGERRRLVEAVSWAAVIVVGTDIGLTVFNKHEEERQPTIYCYVSGEPVTDLEMAIAYTEQTMGLIGGTLRKPMQYLAPLQEFERAMQKLEYLSLLTQHFEGQDTNGTN